MHLLGRRLLPLLVLVATGLATARALRPLPSRPLAQRYSSAARVPRRGVVGGSTGGTGNDEEVSGFFRRPNNGAAGGQAGASSGGVGGTGGAQDDSEVRVSCLRDADAVRCVRNLAGRRVLLDASRVLHGCDPRRPRLQPGSPCPVLTRCAAANVDWCARGRSSSGCSSTRACSRSKWWA